MGQYFVDIYQAISSALVGMSITIKHIWKKPVTLQYPDERQVMSPRFRGFVHNDMDKCDACQICSRACPVDCIYIETEGKGKDRWMTRYAIDYNKCIWCSLCTEGCPTYSITMSHDYDHSVYKRESLVYEYVDPTKQKIPCHKTKREELGFWVLPKPEKKEKPAAAAPEPDAAASAKPAAKTSAEKATDEGIREVTPEKDKPAPESAPSDDKGEEN